MSHGSPLLANALYLHAGAVVNRWISMRAVDSLLKREGFEVLSDRVVEPRWTLQPRASSNVSCLGQNPKEILEMRRRSLAR